MLDQTINSISSDIDITEEKEIYETCTSSERNHDFLHSSTSDADYKEMLREELEELKQELQEIKNIIIEEQNKIKKFIIQNNNNLKLCNTMILMKLFFALLNILFKHLNVNAKLKIFLKKTMEEHKFLLCVSNFSLIMTDSTNGKINKEIISQCNYKINKFIQLKLLMTHRLLFKKLTFLTLTPLNKQKIKLVNNLIEIFQLTIKAFHFPDKSASCLIDCESESNLFNST